MKPHWQALMRFNTIFDHLVVAFLWGHPADQIIQRSEFIEL